MKNRILSVLLLCAMLFTLAACTASETGTDDIRPETSAVTDDTDTVDVETGVETEKDPEAVTDTEEVVIDDDPVFYVKPDKDPVNISDVDFSDTDWSDTISTANQYANAVQGKFTDGGRTAFRISNNNMSMTYHLLQNDTMIVNALCNSKGVPYFENTMDAYIRLENGDVYLASESLYSGRMNSHRLGYYYYDFRFRDQNFINPETKKQYVEGENCIDLLKDYGDKIKGNDIRDLKYSDGKLSYAVSTLTEPSIELDDLSFPTDEYDALQIKLKAESSDILGVLLLVDGAKIYSPDRQLVYRFNAGEETTVVIPFTAMNKLYGTITGMKITLGSVSKETVEIYDLRLLKRGGSNLPLLLERSYHTYPDKVHEQIRAVATSAYSGGGYLGTTTVIPASTVRKMIMKDGNEEYTGIPDDFDFSELEYIGFDIKGVGIFGLIMPSNSRAGTLKVELKDSKYIITREIPLPDILSKYNSAELYHRIYTSDSHQFNDLRKEAYIERNPLTDIQLFDNKSSAKVFYYNKVRGCYDIYVAGAGFVDSYYSTPDKQINANIVISGDGAVDRNIYFNIFTASGALECAAVLDESMNMLPIPVQVCKNFTGEREEERYDPNDNMFGGEAYIPLSLGKDESKKLTVLHLYQNWGKYALKQLSSISFIQPYYHLSLGVTETNCIAPYFVFGKDGWLLPDFRANSAPLWNSQPQHTSIGRLYFFDFFTKTKGDHYLSESQHAEISSAGPLYADVTMDYLSDDGSMTASLRHIELPQPDENRTMYEVRIKVVKDVTISDFKKNFTIFKYDTRYTGGIYNKIGYLDENNEFVIEEANTKRKISRYVKLGTDHPYVSTFDPVFTIPGSENTKAVNMGFVIRDYNAVINGKKYDGNLVFRENAISNQTHIELTLDLEDVTLKAGDEINVDIILLPWGETSSPDDDNVRNVRQDTCIDPYKVSVKIGEDISETYIPKVKAEDNKAEFTFSGGASLGVVRVYGFDSYKKPVIEVKTDGGWQPFETEGVNGYDGYQVYRDEDGTYSFAFIVDMTLADSYDLRVSQ